MTTDDSPARPSVDLSKPPPLPDAPARPGPAWIVVPARVVALIVVVPLRLVYDLVVLVARGVRAVWDRLTRAPGRLARLIGRMLGALWGALYAWLLAPIGRLLAALGRGIGAVLDLLVVRPLRWLAVVVVWGFLRWFGRGTGRLARWIHRMLIAPVGRFLALIGRGAVWLLSVLIGVLVVVPAVFVWRFLLRPPLLAVAWLGRVVWGGLCWLGRGVLSVLGAVGSLLAAGWRAFAGGVAWAWRLIGRCLAWLGLVLFVLPARALWRYLLAPVVAGVVGTWRLAARLLRWLWRTLVVVPVRVLVVVPARWVGANVLRPAGRGLREAWRVTVGDPVRAVRRTMREAGRDVRLQLRRTFRGY